MNNSSISDTIEYRIKCKEFAENDNAFNTFKQDPVYTQILEHASLSQAIEYIKYIESSDLDLTKLNVLKTNDEQGSPTIFNYNNSLFDGISPSTLRYIKTLAELIRIYKSLNNTKIVEIGVGYGGQCKIINDYFKLSSYQLFDLPEVLQLATRYLSKYEYPNVKFGGDISDNYDLVISNYAITECSRDIQSYYIDNIINKSKHGYITCNFISSHFNIDSMSKDEFISKIEHDINIMDEYPQTFNNNFVLYW